MNEQEQKDLEQQQIEKNKKHFEEYQKNFPKMLNDLKEAHTKVGVAGAIVILPLKDGTIIISIAGDGNDLANAIMTTFEQNPPFKFLIMQSIMAYDNIKAKEETDKTAPSALVNAAGEKIELKKKPSPLKVVPKDKAPPASKKK